MGKQQKAIFPSSVKIITFVSIKEKVMSRMNFIKGIGIVTAVVFILSLFNTGYLLSSGEQEVKAIIGSVLVSLSLLLTSTAMLLEYLKVRKEQREMRKDEHQSF